MKIEMDNDFRGNAYIIQNEDVLLKFSGGFADLANEIPNTLNTRFATASMGKTFVAVGILQLIEAGKLKFEDTLGDILDINLKSIDPGVTVEQLLNHTSGVPDYFDESVMDDYEALWTDYPNYRIRHNKDMLPLFIEKPMMYPKGEKFQYNNSGYVLLAMMFLIHVGWILLDTSNLINCRQNVQTAISIVLIQKIIAQIFIPLVPKVPVTEEHLLR